MKAAWLFISPKEATYGFKKFLPVYADSGESVDALLVDGGEVCSFDCGVRAKYFMHTLLIEMIVP